MTNRYWDYSIENCKRALHELYTLCQDEQSVDKCDSVLEVLKSTSLNFQDLKSTLFTSINSNADKENVKLTSQLKSSSTGGLNEESIEIKQTPSSPVQESIKTNSITPESIILHPISLDSSKKSNSSSTLPNLITPIITTTTSTNTSIAPTTSTTEQSMKWSDRLKLALNLNDNPNDLDLSNDNDNDNDNDNNNNNNNNNNSTKLKETYENKQNQAKIKREEILDKKISGVITNRTRLNEFNKRNEENKERKKISIEAKQGRADQLHDQHITQIKQKANFETKKVEEMQWITNQSSESHKYFKQKKFDKLEAKRKKFIEEKRKKSLDSATLREESATRRRKQIESSRAQILLGYMPNSPPISEDPNRKIRRYCRYCNVLITSDEFLENHLQDPRHQVNFKKGRTATQVGTEDGALVLVTLPFDLLSTQLLAPISKEEMERIRELESEMKPTIQNLQNNVFSEKLYQLDYNEKKLILSPLSNGTNIAIYEKVLNEFTNLIAKKDYENLQFLLNDLLILLTKHNQYNDYIYFTKNGGMVNIMKILNEFHNPPSNLIKLSIELLLILCRCEANLIYFITTPGGIVGILDMLSGNILSKPDLVSPFLPPLLKLLNRIITLKDLDMQGHYKTNDFKMDLISYIIGQCIFEKLELKLPRHIQLGLLDSNVNSTIFAQEVIRLLLNISMYYLELKKSNISSFLPPIPESQNFLLTLKKTNLIGILSLLTSTLLRTTKKPVANSTIEISNTLLQLVNDSLQLFIKLSILDLPFIQSFLGSDDYQIEFYHFVNHLLRYTTQKTNLNNNLNGTQQNPIQIQILDRIIVLLGYYSIKNERNQEILHWGEQETILHKLCTLPLVYYFDKDSTKSNIIYPTLITLCLNNRNRILIKQELSIELLNNYYNEHHNNNTMNELLCYLNLNKDPFIID
ncbi:hypothetical protein DLAC_07426 [Tieghemostelium lacteum]|uniref:S phase cyclin A-associated protein in the endoplasmic reticulum N-terminal domain-containing protein n=1 Tax=Tieghemostelium lacteum TaxID=361077 RepID=A0A151ZCI5_TIELA|nr:hypothetical protein DLAC_07426 [Tieghemostelium lacteum]|eukprot:KYQ91649.1 hypothetical protein DLAC_07426 [Tieghemostelium lacteum]